MDPVKILPPEVINLIWLKLPFQDLLTCQLINHSWYQSISECSELWRPLCISTNIINNSWKDTFLDEINIRQAWKVGAFTDVIFEVNQGCKIYCCNEDHIYLINNENIFYKYNKSGEMIGTLEISKNVKHLRSFGKNIALLCEQKDWNEIVIFNEQLEEKKTLQTRDETINTANGKLWAWDANNRDLLKVYSEQNNAEELLVHYGTIMMPLQKGWVTLHNGEVHWMLGNCKTKLYSISQSPMLRPVLEILSNNRDIVAAIEKKVIEGRHKFTSVHIYQNGNKLNSDFIGSYVHQKCFSGELLILCTKRKIHTYDIYKGIINENIYKSKDKIISVHDILEHPKLSWILIKCSDYFVVYDINKLKLLITIPIIGCIDNFNFNKKLLINQIKSNKLLLKIPMT